MIISINNKPADITLNTEKTIGDVLSGLETWISQTGNRIQRVSLDNRDLTDDALSEVFDREIDGIKKLDIFVSSYRELAIEALVALHDTCIFYENAAFNEREEIKADWEKCAAARFLAADIPDIHAFASKTFCGEGLSASNFVIMIEERLRELTDPFLEINNIETMLKNIIQRLEELPLDMQTGKDLRAAETLQIFSQMAEKLFRIMFIHKTEGVSFETKTIDSLPVHTFFDEFNSALTELSEAYENRDTVLAGDIAEYELAPRFLKFYSFLKNTCQASPLVSIT